MSDLHIKGEEERDQLVREGQYLFDQVREEHWEMASYRITSSDTGKKWIPWRDEEGICIALALFARKKGIEEGINNV